MRITTLTRFFTLLSLFVSICTDYTGANELTKADCHAAISAVRSWINDDLQIPQEYYSTLPIETSVCIILRHHGQLLGVGVASNSKQPLLDAATIAFDEANANTIFAQLSQEFKKQASSSISIELELGEKPIASPHVNFKRFANKIDKGIDGVGVRRLQKWDIRMPAILRLSPKREVESVLASICLNVGVHPVIAISGNLSTNEDVTFYKIPTIAYYQKNAFDEVRILVRGNELVPLLENKTELEKLANQLATHLFMCIRETGSVIGGYQPETNSLSAPFATPFIQLMVASALEEYAEIAPITMREKARMNVSLVLNDVVKKYYDNENIPISIASAVVITVSLSQAPWNAEVQQFISECKKYTIQVARDITTEKTEIKKPHTLAMVALAISTIAVQSKDKRLKSLAEETCLHCIHSVPLQSKISIIPWIAEAVLLLNKHGSNLSISPLNELVDLALSSQMLVNKNSDLYGGFQLINKDGLETDARGLRMLPMLVQMKHIKGQNQSLLHHSILGTTRFIAQLTTSKTSSNRFQNPSMAFGGVRASTWDASMPTEATAMALIGITRVLRSISPSDTQR